MTLLLAIQILGIVLCFGSSAVNLWQVRRQRQAALRAIVIECALRLARKQLGWDAAITVQQCTICGGLLRVTAATGHTVEQAIAAAVQELPERVDGHTKRDHSVTKNVQPHLPGLHPVFDVAAALELIEQQELAASVAEKDFARAHEHAKECRKQADVENTKLRELIRELNERRHDSRYEAPAEQSEGNPGESEGNSIEASREAAEYPNQAGADSLRAAGFSPALDASASVDASAVPRPVDPDGSIALVDALLTDAADLDPVDLQNLLAMAGALVTVDAITAWTVRQRCEATDWADAQIDANDEAEPGVSVSVRWPDHVSAAHHAHEGTPTMPQRRVVAGEKRRTGTGTKGRAGRAGTGR